MRLADLTGKKFGSWTVIRRGPNATDRSSRWICVCDCDSAKEWAVSGSKLRNGRSARCAICYKRSRIKYNDGLTSWQRWKARNPELVKEYAKKYRNSEKGKAWWRGYVEKNKEKIELRRKLWRYGLSIDQWGELQSRANGLCEICHLPETKTVNGTLRALSIDHDHRTGCVRGLLCDRCNTVIGAVEESPELLRLLIEYIEQHSAQRAA